MRNSKPTYGFVHIEKAAGTSLIHEIRKRFLFSYTDVRPLKSRTIYEITADDLKTYKIIMPLLQFIGGHSVVLYSDIEAEFPNIQYITILRDPIKRLESHYWHWVQRKNFQGGFLDFANQDFMKNFMCKKIAGIGSSVAATEALRDKFIAFGVQENIFEFVQVLRDKIPEFENLNYLEKRNKRKIDQKIKYDQKDIDYICDLNREDIALYEFVFSQNQINDKLENSPHFVNNNIIYESKKYADYALRKLWIEPVSGVIRLKSGLPYRGSYQDDIYG